MFYDPQADAGHYCAVCGREMFGAEDICQKCKDRMSIDDDVDYE